MRQLFTFLLSLPLILSAQHASTWPKKEIRVHDPVMALENGMYHIFCTGRGIAHFSSPDMENWTYLEPVFPEKPAWTDAVVDSFRNHIWAPDVLFRNNTYYLYYSVSAFAKNTSAIGVATNKTLDPESPNYQWIDHGIVIQSHPNRDLWNAIDPNIIIDDSNIPWMAFGSFWNGLKLVKMSDDMLSIAEPQEWHTLARRERSFDVSDTDPGNAALEAPFIFKKGDYYYLFLSWDLCCRGANSTYKVVVGRSKKVTGPYLDKTGKDLFMGGGTLVIEGDENWFGAGHNSIYSFNGIDNIVFHAYDAQDEGHSKLKIKQVSWNNGWPVVKNPLD